MPIRDETASHISRRRLLTGTGVLMGAAMLGPVLPVSGQATGWRTDLPEPPEPLAAGRTVTVSLRAAERATALPAFGGLSLPLWTFVEGTSFPVVRVPFGAALDVDFENALPRAGEHATIHWHGIRLPNDQDGVPYLVQEPVLPGGRHRYRFVPPDTGTFFFHTHCNTAEHLGRGLVGVLIVEGDESEPYDADELLVLRDWRLDQGSGTFLPFSTDRGAAEGGTLGEVRSVNGAVDPEIAPREPTAASAFSTSTPHGSWRPGSRAPMPRSSPSTGSPYRPSRWGVGQWGRGCGST